MKQDTLLTFHRAVNALASPLRPIRPMLLPFKRLADRLFNALVSLRYPPGSLMVATQNGRRWRLAPEVALRGALQEYETILWFREVVTTGMDVIDVGANVGQMTLELAELVGPEGRVLAIEPAQGNIAVLRRHIAGNGFDRRVDLVEAACGNRHGGSVSFFVFGDRDDSIGSGHSTVARIVPDMTRHEIRVPQVSLDALCADRQLTPRIIKIDVEGGEIGVLEGATQTLKMARPILRIGFHPFAFDDVQKASDRLRALLREHRYAFEGPPSGPLELAEYVARPLQQ
jgi:FkbM family methyltransferase